MTDSNRIPNFFTQSRSKFAMTWAFFKKNPFCWIKLERGAKLIAIFLMILGILLMLMSILLLIVYIPFQKQFGSVTVANLTQKIPASSDRVGMGMWYIETFIAFGFVWGVFWFILHAVVYRGICVKSYITVNGCWKTMAWFTFIDVTFTIVMLFLRRAIVMEWTEVVSFGINLYAIWVIYAYKDELKRGADLGQGHFRRDFP